MLPLLRTMSAPSRLERTILHSMAPLFCYIFRHQEMFIHQQDNKTTMYFRTPQVPSICEYCINISHLCSRTLFHTSGGVETELTYIKYPWLSESATDSVSDQTSHAAETCLNVTSPERTTTSHHGNCIEKIALTISNLLFSWYVIVLDQEASSKSLIA